MGFDIHPFVEYDYSSDGPPFADPISIRPFNEGELFWWRDPVLFRAMGWMDNEDSRTPLPTDSCLHPARGLPNHYSTAVLNRFFYILDDRGYSQGYHPALGSVRTDVGQKWLEEGISISGPPLIIARSRHGTEQLSRVSNPTWKQPSWLTTTEFIESIDHAGLSVDSLKPEVRSSIELMKLLESEFGTGHVRLVFWFDS